MVFWSFPLSKALSSVCLNDSQLILPTVPRNPPSSLDRASHLGQIPSSFIPQALMIHIWSE